MPALLHNGTLTCHAIFVVLCILPLLPSLHFTLVYCGVTLLEHVPTALISPLLRLIKLSLPALRAVTSVFPTVTPTLAFPGMVTVVLGCCR